MSIQVIVASHKPYWMPSDPTYLPLHVGKKDKTSIGFIGDDEGDNISAKNANYCELTGLYWAWKNLDSDYIGLAHYRRYFVKKRAFFCSPGRKMNYVLTGNELKSLLDKCSIIVPKKRRYFIETNYSHYVHAHHKEGLDLTGRIIQDHFPDYYNCFNMVMNRTWAHMFNMFIMKRDYFLAYCDWLFAILFQVEEQLDISGYDVSEARVFGYISELLFDVWLEKNCLHPIEIPVAFLESQNWIKKTFQFLNRKLNPLWGT